MADVDGADAEGEHQLEVGEIVPVRTLVPGRTYGARKKAEAAWKQLELLKIGILVPRLHVRMQCSLNTTTVQISCCHFGVFTAVFIAVAAF